MMCLVTVRTGLGPDYLDITVICDVTAERSNVLDEMRAAELCQAHRVHAQLAAGLARPKTERHAQNANFLTCHKSCVPCTALSYELTWYYVSPKPLVNKLSTAAIASSSSPPS